MLKQRGIRKTRIDGNAGTVSEENCASAVLDNRFPRSDLKRHVVVPCSIEPVHSRLLDSQEMVLEQEPAHVERE